MRKAVFFGVTGNRAGADRQILPKLRLRLLRIACGLGCGYPDNFPVHTHHLAPEDHEHSENRAQSTRNWNDLVRSAV